MRSHDSKGLTKKQRFWLGHLKACAASGKTLRSYAAAHDLSVQQLYGWKSRLRQRGISAGSVSRPGGVTKGQPSAVRQPSRDKVTALGFTAVRLATEEGPRLGLRIRFPNGILLEMGSSTQAIPDPRLLSILAALS